MRVERGRWRDCFLAAGSKWIQCALGPDGPSRSLRTLLRTQALVALGATRHTPRRQINGSCCAFFSFRAFPLETGHHRTHKDVAALASLPDRDWGHLPAL